MPLFKTHSPSRASLTVPHSAPGSATSSRSASPSAPNTAMQDDTFRNVKLVEELLKAWNEHRQALAGCAKTGKRLAKAMCELGLGLDKTGVAAQTLRPTASAFEGCADVTAKWAKRVDKEYEACNKEAGAYFSLLAKETRSHEAYLLGINKRHASAERAYRKASKSLTDTSSTHSALVHLQQSLSTDVQRANADHLALLSSKQGSLLLSVAARSGSLGAGLTSLYSEGLKSAAVHFKDIEYFRVLAESRWTASLPCDLDETDQGRMREMMRIQKARVAMGELDVVGDAVWDNMARPRMGRVVSESVLNKHTQPSQRPPIQTSQSSAFSGSSMMTASTGLSSVTSPTVSSPSTGKGSWGQTGQTDMNPNHRQLPSTSPEDAIDHLKFTPGHNLGSRVSSGSISIPTPRRSVSQIAADLEALTHSPLKTNLDSPSQAEKGSRRVTMPPLYAQGIVATPARTLPAVQPRRASVQPKPPGGFPFPAHEGVASPTPKRPVRLSTIDLELAADRA